MKKYNDNDIVVNGFEDMREYLKDVSVEEVIKRMWEESGDNSSGSNKRQSRG